MRVLSINTSAFQPKTTNSKQIKNSGLKQQPVIMNSPSFKSDTCTVAAASIFGAIFAGAAALFAAPVALVAGAAALGALSGAGMAQDDEPLNDTDRYKYTHEY